MKIELSAVHDSPCRLREVVKDEAFYELADSLHKHGLLQPIKVRPTNGGYELVYGHRRAAAMRHLGWTECEAIVEDVDDKQALLQAVIENLHRQDLDALEEAKIYQTLREQGNTITQIAQTIHKSRTYVSDRLYLLDLPAEVQEVVKRGDGQNVATTTQSALSLTAASRISTATQSPTEALQVTRKAIDERLTNKEISQLAAQLRQAQTPQDRQRVIERPFRPLQSETAPAPTSDKTFPASASRPFHTADRPVSDQFHAKWIWNLRRIDLKQFAHFTIGYSQRSWPQVEELLQLAQITVLVDARRNAVSQYRPEFSRANLEAVAEAAGIAYRHLPALGIPAEERADLAETQDYDGLFSAYDRRLHENLLVNMLGDSLATERLAFLCVELDPNTCHRHRIALFLEKMGYPTFDL